MIERMYAFDFLAVVLGVLFAPRSISFFDAVESNRGTTTFHPRTGSRNQIYFCAVMEGGQVIARHLVRLTFVDHISVTGDFDFGTLHRKKQVVG